MTGLGIDGDMTRIVSVALLLVVALGAGSELALAAEVSEVRVETNGLEPPPAQHAEEIEVSDEVVFVASSVRVLGTPLAMYATDRRSESLLDGPLTRPPRG
ncbi:MAG: hypothetical protein Rubg2KO_14540 [Rubricoccaceae bacterium]